MRYIKTQRLVRAEANAKWLAGEVADREKTIRSYRQRLAKAKITLRKAEVYDGEANKRYAAADAERKVREKAQAKIDRAKRAKAEKAAKKFAAAYSAKNGTAPFVTTIDTAKLPAKGVAVKAYKMVCCADDKGSHGHACLELLIPARAERVMGTDESSHKCRASEAYVVRVIKTSPRVSNSGLRLFAHQDNTFKYTIGKTHKPKSAYENSYRTCASGIHFFLTQKNAESYLGY